jgi:hypothetical protein
MTLPTGSASAAIASSAWAIASTRPPSSVPRSIEAGLAPAACMAAMSAALAARISDPRRRSSAAALRSAWSLAAVGAVASLAAAARACTPMAAISESTPAASPVEKSLRLAFIAAILSSQRAAIAQQGGAVASYTLPVVGQFEISRS